MVSHPGKATDGDVAGGIVRNADDSKGDLGSRLDRHEHVGRAAPYDHPSRQGRRERPIFETGVLEGSFIEPTQVKPGLTLPVDVMP